MFFKEKLYIYTGETIHKSSLHPIQLDVFDVVSIDHTFHLNSAHLIVRPIKGGHTPYTVYFQDLMPYEEFPEDVFESVVYNKLLNNGV